MHGQNPANPTSEPSARPPRSRRRRLLLLGLTALLAYPLAVLIATFALVFASGLPGGSHGPADACRHALASALVAYTLSPRCVDWVTALMEGGDPEPSHRMDAHNNRVGARLAARATTLRHLVSSVRRAVERGAEIGPGPLRDPDRIVWLPEVEWANAWW